MYQYVGIKRTNFKENQCLTLAYYRDLLLYITRRQIRHDYNPVSCRWFTIFSLFFGSLFQHLSDWNQQGGPHQDSFEALKTMPSNKAGLQKLLMPKLNKLFTTPSYKQAKKAVNFHYLKVETCWVGLLNFTFASSSASK